MSSKLPGESAEKRKKTLLLLLKGIVVGSGVSRSLEKERRKERIIRVVFIPNNGN